MRFLVALSLVLVGCVMTLPADDHASRAIVTQMKADERHHAEEALAAGGLPLPQAVQVGMRVVAKVMTTTAHHI